MVYWSLLLVNIFVWPFIAVLALTASPSWSWVTSKYALIFVIFVVLFIPRINIRNKALFIILFLFVVCCFLVPSSIRGYLFALLPHGLSVFYLVVVKNITGIAKYSQTILVYVLVCFVVAEIVLPLANWLFLFQASLTIPELDMAMVGPPFTLSGLLIRSSFYLPAFVTVVYSLWAKNA